MASLVCLHVSLHVLAGVAFLHLRRSFRLCKSVVAIPGQDHVVFLRAILRYTKLQQERLVRVMCEQMAGIQMRVLA